VSDWLAEVRLALESESGADLELGPAEIDELLGVARTAAHESGAKLNAPLVCYLLGRATGLSERTLSELVPVVLTAGREPDCAI
jgi:hypothetical protein